MTRNKTFLKDNLLEIHIFIILYYILYYITLKYRLFSYSFLPYSSLFNNKILTTLSQTMTHRASFYTSRPFLRDLVTRIVSQFFHCQGERMRRINHLRQPVSYD